MVGHQGTFTSKIIQCFERSGSKEGNNFSMPKSFVHKKGFEFCTIKGQGQNLTPPYKIVNNMIFKYVCISIGFTFKSGSKMKFADNTFKKSPCSCGD